MNDRLQSPSDETRACPLCGDVASHYLTDARRAYFQCPRCDLVFADPASHLSREAERAVYDRHRNSPNDVGYRKFLNRLAAPLLDRLTPGMRGLDYGSGPGPTLSVMLEEAGLQMTLYDPHYAPDPPALAQVYDFVVCSETAEHFRRPADDWCRLAALLRPRGWLGVMTKRVINRQRFSTWHYKLDPTHVSFYSLATFHWIGDWLGFSVEPVADDVVLMQQQSLPEPSATHLPGAP